jgi:4-diphosphocytidyl-2-C-methyl-D-erythritol kinase
VLRLLTRAPAKVNLVLSVGPARDDGYHDIDSLMAPLDLADEVEVRVHRGRTGEVSCRVPGRPDLDGPGNLAARAAVAFRLKYGVQDRVDIAIRKRIPVVAGLGGGSSDAAAALRCLARAYRVRDAAGLAEVGLSVGSDVPFFLGLGPAWAAGRGERLRPAEVPPQWALLLYPRAPELAIRAGDAYRWLDLARQGSRAVASRPRRFRRFEPRRLQNDLQGPCFERFPALAELATLLEERGAAGAIMSGSGPTVFGLFPSPQAARAAERAAARVRVGGAGVDAIVARTTRRQPGVSSWRSPRSASSRSTRTSSRRT